MQNIKSVEKKLKPFLGEQTKTFLEKDSNKDFNKWKRKAFSKIKEIKLFELFGDEIEKQSIILENFLGKWGNISIESICKLCLIAKHLKPKKIFEFGTFNGMTTLQLAMNTDAKIYTLDLPSDVTPKFTLSNIDKHINTHFDGKLNTSIGSYFKDKFQDRIIQLLGDSATFDYSEFYNEIDIVLIDAAHDYENKKSDSENALKMIKEGGVILWDNFNDKFNPYVTKYLSELDLPLYYLKNTNLVIYKK